MQNNNEPSPAWAVEGRYVHFEGKPLKRADPRTFRMLNHLYARDASSLFCKAGHVSAIVDPASFEVLDPGWYQPSHGDIVYAGYARDGGNVYFAEADSTPPRLVRGADASTFVSLGFGYGRDARQVYLQTRVIRGAMPESFELVNALYSRDARHVYYDGRLIEGAVASEFVLIDERRGRDNQRIYEIGRAIEPADSAASRKQRLSSWLPRRPGWLRLIPFVAALLLALGSALIDLFRRRPETKEAKQSPPTRAPDMRLFAETLAMGDAEALAPVLLAIEDPDAFVQEYSGRGSFADQPDYENLIAEAEEDGLHPFTVLTEVYQTRGLFGFIDWRSFPEETISQVEPMLHRFGIRDFDWSFIEVLYDHGDGTEMRNQNFLSLLRDRLQPLGLTFVHINLLSDSYGFVVLRTEDYRKIEGFEDPGQFIVSTDFGADEAYERGKQILAEAEARG